MKALVFHGPRDVRIDDVPDPKIEKATRRFGENYDDQHLRIGLAYV